MARDAAVGPAASAMRLQAAGVGLSPTSVRVSESGVSATYTVVLTSQPSGNVTITVATPGGQATAVSTVGGTSALTFTRGNWDQPQSVTVRAVDDNVAEGDHTTRVTHTASGGGYDSVSIGDVVVEIEDNDVRGASVSPRTVDVAEGGATATYTLVLTSEPTANVTVAIAPSGGQVTATATATGLGTLTFTPSNWDHPQSITVTAIDDGIVEGDHSASIAHSASGGGYTSTRLPSVTARIADSDGGLVLSRSTVRVREGGRGETYTVVLAARPSSSVNVALAVAGGQITALSTRGGNSSLTFTTSNWSTPQSVTVTALDDDIVEGEHEATIAHVASGGLSGFLATVRVVISDNDSPRDGGRDREKPAACSNASLHPSLHALCRVLDEVPPHVRPVLERVIERHAEHPSRGQIRGEHGRGTEHRTDDERDERRRDDDRDGDGRKDKDDRSRARGEDGHDGDDDRRRGGNRDDDRRREGRRGPPPWAGRPGGMNR